MMLAFSSLRREGGRFVSLEVNLLWIVSFEYEIGLLFDQVDLLGREMFVFTEDWLLVGDGCGNCGGCQGQCRAYQ